MKTLDKTMQWVEEHTNFFVVTVCGIVWSMVIYSTYLILTGEQQ